MTRRTSLFDLERRSGRQQRSRRRTRRGGSGARKRGLLGIEGVDEEPAPGPGADDVRDPGHRVRLTGPGAPATEGAAPPTGPKAMPPDAAPPEPVSPPPPAPASDPFDQEPFAPAPAAPPAPGPPGAPAFVPVPVPDAAPMPPPQSGPVRSASPGPPAGAVAAALGDAEIEDDLIQLRQAAAGAFGSDAPARSGAAAPPPPEPADDPHALFDRMRMGAAQAETFSLPPVELERRFDAFERALDAQETASVHAPPPSAASSFSNPRDIQDVELAEDLARMRKTAEEMGVPLPKPGGAKEPPFPPGPASPPAADTWPPRAAAPGPATTRPQPGPAPGDGLQAPAPPARPDAASPSSSPPDATTPAPAETRPQDVLHALPIIRSGEGLSAPAAAAAMIVARRHGLPAEVEKIKAGEAGWAVYAEHAGKGPDGVLDGFGLQRVEDGAHEPGAVAGLLVEKGPLWMQGPGTDAFGVIRGSRAGATPDARDFIVVDATTGEERAVPASKLFASAPPNEARPLIRLAHL